MDFETCLRRCQTSEDVTERKRIAAKWGATNPDIGAIGSAIEQLRAIDGLGSIVDRVEARWRRSQRQGRQDPQPDGGPEPARTLATWLESEGCPDALLPDEDITTPGGWACVGRTLSKVSAKGIPTLVAAAPVAVVARAVDADSSAVCVVLVWRYARRWRSRVVQRRHALTRDGLLGLVDDGLPVDQSTATDLARWLAACDLALTCDPRPALGRLGWLPDGSDHAPAGSVAVIPPGDGERFDLGTYRAAGSLEGWKRGVWASVAGYQAEVAILASLAAPLLHVVQTTGWTLDLGFRQGSGKTTAQQAAASVWGARDSIIPWPRTWAAMRGSVEFRADVPCILDDTKNLDERAWPLVKTLLYQVAGDRSQSLGSAGGGTRAARMVRTIVISSGEAPIADRLQSADGARFRILTLADRPFPPGYSAGVQSIERASRQHYGHAGPRLVRWLIGQRETWPDLQARWLAHAKRIGGDSDDDRRLAQRIALLWLAAELAEEVIGICPSTDVLESFTTHACGGVAERDPAADALRHVTAHLAARPEQVVGWVVPSAQRTPFLATSGPMELGLVVSELTPILAAAGYDVREIRRLWSERGWLGRCAPGRDGRPRTDRPERVAGHMARVVPVLIDAIREHE